VKGFGEGEGGMETSCWSFPMMGMTCIPCITNGYVGAY